MILHFLKILEFEKAHLFFELILKVTQLQKNSRIGYFSKNSILHFSFKYEVGTKRCSSCSSAVFIKRFYFCRKETDHFWGFNAFLNKQKLKEKFSDNLGQNIRRIFNFLAKFLFTTSERELDYYQEKRSARVASRVAKRLKIEDLSELGNFQKITETLGFDGKYPAVQPKDKFWHFLVKYCKKSAVKHFIEKPIFLNFVNLSQTFCPRLCEKTDFYFQLGADPLILHFLNILVFEKAHLLFKLILKGTQLH